MSLFDIDPAIGGQQPNGFDEWSALYELYRVNHVKLTVSVENLEATALAFLVFPTSTSSDPGLTYTAALGARGVKSFLIPQRGSGRNVITRTFSWSA